MKLCFLSVFLITQSFTSHGVFAKPITEEPEYYYAPSDPSKVNMTVVRDFYQKYQQFLLEETRKQKEEARSGRRQSWKELALKYGGAVTDITTYPFLGSVLWGRFTAAPFCMTLIIDTLYSISPAYCMSPVGGQTLYSSYIYDGVNGVSDSEGETVKLDNFITPAGWLAVSKNDELYDKTVSFNIGLFQAKEPGFGLNNSNIKTKPYPLWNQKPINYTAITAAKCKVVGYSKDFYENILQFDTEVITLKLCEKKVLGCVMPDHICTVSKSPNHGICNMILGSLLVCDDDVIGILIDPWAFGQCGSSVDRYMRFTNLNSHLEWLENITDLALTSKENITDEEVGLKNTFEELDFEIYVLKLIFLNLLVVALVFLCCWIRVMLKKDRRRVIEECICKGHEDEKPSRFRKSNLKKEKSARKGKSSKEKSPARSKSSKEKLSPKSKSSKETLNK